MKVSARPISRRLVLHAEFEPFQEVEVHAKLAGYLKDIYVDVGSRVQSGQLLAVLSAPELEREQQQAEAAVTRREAELVRAQEELRRAQSVHESIHLGAARLVEVNQSHPNLVPQQDVDDAVSKDKAAEAQISADTAALEAGRAALTDAKANVGRVASLADYTRIRAPFAAVVTRRYEHVGAMVPAGTSSTQSTPIIKLSQNDPLRLVVPIPESAVPSIQTGTQVRVHVGVLNRSFTATVSRFASELDLSTRTMRAEIDIPNTDLELKPGEYADVEIVLQRKESALTVPIQAVLSPDKQPSVLIVARGNVVEKRDVTLGLESSTHFEVLTGLRGDEVVIANAPREFKPGQRVVPALVSVESGESD